MSDLLEQIRDRLTGHSDRFDRIETTLSEILSNQKELKTMSDQLSAALAPLDAGIAQNSADILNLGSVVSADFAALQGSIAALQGSIAAGQTIPAADLTDIGNQVSVLAQAHTALTAVIASLGTATPAV